MGPHPVLGPHRERIGHRAHRGKTCGLREKMAICKPRREGFKEKLCLHLDLGRPVSRLVRKEMSVV